MLRNGFLVGLVVALMTVPMASAAAREMAPVRPLAAANAFWDQYLPDTCANGVPTSFDAPAVDVVGLALLNDNNDGVCPIRLMPALRMASARDQCIAITHEVGHWRLYRALGFVGHMTSGIMTASVTASTPQCDRLGPPAVSKRRRHR